LLLIRAAQRVLFEQMDKETLDKILRFRRSVAAVTKKGVKRRPIPFAEDRQSLGRLRGIGTPRLQNYCPVCRLKRRTPLLQRSRYWFHKLGDDGITLQNATPPEQPILRGKKIDGAFVILTLLLTAAHRSRRRI